jgi:hypothetical protein
VANQLFSNRNPVGWLNPTSLSAKETNYCYPPPVAENLPLRRELPPQWAQSGVGPSELCENFLQYFLQPDFCSDDEDVLGKTVPMRLEGITEMPYYLFVPADLLETDGIYIVKAVFQKLYNKEIPGGVLRTIVISPHESSTFQDLIIDGAVWFRWNFIGVGGARRKNLGAPKRNKQQKKSAPKRQARSSPRNQKAGPVKRPRNMPTTQALVPRSAGGMPLLSRCAQLFAFACVDPFNPAARGVCCPSTPAPPSQKICVFSRFVTTVGTAGVGAIWMTPSLCNNSPSIFTTTVLYTKTLAASETLPILSAANSMSPGVVAINAPTPYTAAQMTVNFVQGAQLVAGRILCCGLRVQYTGTELNMSGLNHCFIDATHDNVSWMGYADIDSTTVGVIEPNSREPCMLVSCAMSTQEVEYPSDAYAANPTLALYPWSNGETTFSNVIGSLVGGLTYDSGVGTQTGAPLGIIIIQGVAGTTVFSEYIMHAEYTGTLTQSANTPSDSDPEGLSLVQSAIANIPQLRQASQKRKSGWSYFTEALKGVYRDVKPIAVPLLEAGITALFL